MIFDFGPFADRTACIHSSGRSITYGELDGLAGRIGNHADPHRLVFSLCGNSVGAIAGYVAFLRNGDATLLLDARMTQKSFDSIAEVYRPRYVWAPANCRLVSGADRIFEAESYVLWDTRENGTAVADDLALLLATSGSTGSPKLVRLSKENLRANAAAIIEYLHLTDRERPVLGLPMNYAFGLSIINSHLLTGATLLLTEDAFVQREFWDFAKRNGFTSYSGVPYAFETIRKLGIWKQEMPTLRTLTQAGGALNREHVLFFDETFRPRGVKFYVMYGQSEATARIAYLDPEYIPTKAGSIGEAIPGGRLSLMDENGKPITASNTVGELVYEGPNVCLGYAERAEDLAKGDENRGVIHTGDMAYRDAEGFYFITGRKSRFIKLFGIRICLDHAELMLQPFLTDCACTGDDSHLTVFTTDAGVDEEAVIDLLSSRTMIPRKAFRVWHVDEIPRLESGKVQYGKLEEVAP